MSQDTINLPERVPGESEDTYVQHCRELLDKEFAKRGIDFSSLVLTGMKSSTAKDVSGEEVITIDITTDFMSPQCRWDEAWVGHCKDIATETGFCAEHSDRVCCSCEGVATHSCEETGMGVCCAPLCDDCTHNTYPDGTNGMMGGFPNVPMHVKKTEVKSHG